MRNPLFWTMQGPRLLARLRAWVPLLIFFLGLTVTFLVWGVLRQQTSEQAQAAFEFQVSKFSVALDSYLSATGQVLRGVAGLFAVSRQVEPDDFRRYAAVLRAAGVQPE